MKTVKKTVEHWVQLKLSDGVWIDYGKKESPDDVFYRIVALKEEHHKREFRGITRLITDTLINK